MNIVGKKSAFFFAVLFYICQSAYSQDLELSGDSLLVRNDHVNITADLHSGKVHYRFTSGVQWENTIAYVDDIRLGQFSSDRFSRHIFTSDTIRDVLGKGICLNLLHEDESSPLKLVQHISIYESQPFILISVEAQAKETGLVLETRNISPLTVLPSKHGRVIIPGSEALLTDYPFDNDNWVDVISRQWPSNQQSISGISYELASVHDRKTSKGFAIGSLLHDFWKTGIRYGTGTSSNIIDSLIVYGGAATKDDPSLPDSYGGKDGTHDYVAHGTFPGEVVYSPLLYLSSSNDVRYDLMGFGNTLKKINGSKNWAKSIPFYWNSFGVEGVLGYEKVMMPFALSKVSDFIHSMDNFNKTTQPVLSIDSYDQTIYSTEVLKSISRYGAKKGQQMGFYFIPFSLWTWKTHINESKLTGTQHLLRDVILRDSLGNYIPYKDGDWGAFPIDPTHPATREFIIGQLLKAKAIDAKFIKIDFLSAGALESATRYDPTIRSGIQAYDYGMKMLNHLVDSILGPDIFITQAISPLFPSQYAHTRFLSTDVHSHLRNDLPGFPHYGSTAASMISATHFWWTQNTLWPYSNMDVIVMKKFQKHAEISEQDLKVRLYSMITLGSLLGDGSDYRDKEVAERAMKYLNNKAVCEYFSNPKAFTPLRFPEGNGQAQQLSYYLPGDTMMVAVFNFDTTKKFTETFKRDELNWRPGAYLLQDFLTEKKVGKIDEDQNSFNITADERDAVLLKCIPVKPN